MTFSSILFEEPEDGLKTEAVEVPRFFGDLNLDRIVDAITADWKEYDLKPFFHSPLRDVRQIAYRQQIMRDLEDNALMQAVKSFSEQMRAMRARLDQANKAKRFEYKYAMQRLFVSAVGAYCGAVERLWQDLCAIKIGSLGLRAFREYLTAYVASDPFQGLAMDAGKVKMALAGIRYCLLLRDGSVTVRNCEGEDDYSIAVEELFETFRRDAVRGYRIEIRKWDGMNHIEAQIQERVALLYPDIFRSLEAFCAAHVEYLDKTVARFDREVQFYVAYLTHVEKFRRAGLNFCLPQVSRTSKEIHGCDAFDLALAGKLLHEESVVVPNDFF
jgi:DNA mismatch repair protein MutS